jgi:hypothetical protein
MFIAATYEEVSALRRNERIDGGLQPSGACGECFVGLNCYKDVTPNGVKRSKFGFNSSAF